MPTCIGFWWAAFVGKRALATGQPKILSYQVYWHVGVLYSAFGINPRYAAVATGGIPYDGQRNLPLRTNADR